MVRKWIPLLCALWLVLVSQISLFAAESSYPPVPPHSFYAEDYTSVLDGSTKEDINRIGKALEKQTGAQVVLAVVPSVPDGDIETYANGFFRARGFGNREKNNGILLLVSLSDRKARIEVGYGLEGALNDAKAGRILDETLIPRFQEGNYNGGVKAAYLALVKVCMEEYHLENLPIDGNDMLYRDTQNTEAAELSPLELIFLCAGFILLITIDQKFFGGFFTQILIQLLMMILMRGGRGGGFGSRGGGGSAGGGGASRKW